MNTAIKIILIVYRAITILIIAHYIPLTLGFSLSSSTVAFFDIRSFSGGCSEGGLLIVAFTHVHHDKQSYRNEQEAVGDLEVIY